MTTEEMGKVICEKFLEKPKDSCPECDEATTLMKGDLGQCVFNTMLARTLEAPSLNEVSWFVMHMILDAFKVGYEQGKSNAETEMLKDLLQL